MPEILRKIPEQFMDFWNNLDKKNRTKLMIMSAVIFLSVVIAILVISRPQYQELVSDLETKEMQDVIAQLEKSGISYDVDDNGAVSVEKNDLKKARASLLQEGLPRSGVSFDDYNKTSLGTTDTERQKRYQEYKERDLAATLKEMDNVRDAAVKLSIPEKTAFFGAKAEKAKASVVIDSYDELTSTQIKGIERFVAGSVEGLEPENVTILDNNTNILNQQGDESIASSLDKQYALKQSVKRGVENQVKEILSPLADNVSVMANLELDFDTLITNREIYEPVVDGEGIIRSMQSKKESATNSTTGGAPGTDSNLPVYPNESNGETGEYKLTDEVTNYEVNKIVEQSTKAIGKVNPTNSSIAVILHYKQVSDGVEARPRANAEDVKETVAAGAGIPIEKVDVQINELPSIADAGTPISVMAIRLFEVLAPLILVAILIGLIVLAIFRMNGTREEVALQPATGSMKYAMSARDNEMLPDIELEDGSEVKKQIEKFVKQKPDAVAQLLRNWLAEDWD